MAYKDKADIVAYRKKHRAEANERARLWRLANPERARAKSKECRDRKKAEYAAKARLYRAKNRDRVRENQKRWREENKYSLSEKRRAGSVRASLKSHGLTVADYEAILGSQGGGCAICRSPAPRMKNARRLYVDHCHKTDAIRGLLCFRCNTMLGCADDVAERLRRAAAYLDDGGGSVRRSRRGLLEQE